MVAHLTIRSQDDAARLMEVVRASALRVRDWMASQTGDPLETLRKMKFEPIGFHPVKDRALNFVEQINQTWTFAVAIAATKQLLNLRRGSPASSWRRGEWCPDLFRMVCLISAADPVVGFRSIQRQAVGQRPLFAHSGRPGWRLRMIAILPSQCSAGTLSNARSGRTFAVPRRCWKADVAPNPAIPPFKMMGWITRTLRQEASDSADYAFHPIRPATEQPVS
jgi:hypothetical protein